MSTTNQDSAHAPFGWYPDPVDSTKLRWWNGEQWTERTEYPRPELQPAFGYSTTDLSVTRHYDYA